MKIIKTLTLMILTIFLNGALNKWYDVIWDEQFGKCHNEHPESLHEVFNCVYESKMINILELVLVK